MILMHNIQTEVNEESNFSISIGYIMEYGVSKMNVQLSERKPNPQFVGVKKKKKKKK